MPFRWHIHLPGPVAYSRPMRKKRSGSGPLTTVLVWFIVKPLELIFRGLTRPFTARQRQAPADRPFVPPMLGPGWHDTAWGPLYWSGTNWYDPQGRAIF